MKKLVAEHPERAMVAQRIAQDLVGRITVLLELGLGYLVARTQHAHAFARRAAAAAAGHASPLQSCSASSMCSTNLRPGCIPPTPKHCWSRSNDSRPRAIRCSSSNTISTSSAMPTGLSTSGRPRESRGATSSTAGPPPGCEQVEASQTRHHLFGRHLRAQPHAPPRPRAGSACGVSRAITSTSSMPPFRWGSSPP